MGYLRQTKRITKLNLTLKEVVNESVLMYISTGTSRLVKLYPEATVAATTTEAIAVLWDRLIASPCTTRTGKRVGSLYETKKNPTPPLLLNLMLLKSVGGRVSNVNAS